MLFQTNNVNFISMFSNVDILVISKKGEKIVTSKVLAEEYVERFSELFTHLHSILFRFSSFILTGFLFS